MNITLPFPPGIGDLIDFDGAGGIFFIYSTESYILKKVKASIVEQSQSRKWELVLLDHLDDKDALKEAVSLAREIGFFFSKKVILLEHFSSPDVKVEKLLVEALKEAEPGNLLFILVSDLDRRKKFYKEFSAKRDIFFEIPFPEQSDLELFVKSLFGEITPDKRLIAHFMRKESRDLFHIDSEVSKLRLYAESRGMKKLSFEEASHMLTGISEEKVFAIVDLLQGGRVEEAIKFYRQLKISEGEYKLNPVLVSILFKHLKAMLKAKIFIKEGRERELFSYLRGNRVFVDMNSFKGRVAKTKNRDLVVALGSLSEIELGMKGAEGIGMSDAGVVLERFMVDTFSLS